VVEGKSSGAVGAGHEAKLTALTARYDSLVTVVDGLRDSLDSEVVEIVTADERRAPIGVGRIHRILKPNDMNPAQKARAYLARLWTFLSQPPRESNVEGGILPAIFGTVLMTLLMTLAVVPLGVVAGLFLREYAHQGRLVRLVRIAVNNLAGVPSIVFGIFGLGFFVYAMGGTIDRLFFSDLLPSPTFGTGGILWSALTLAFLTVPVVIVATEEGLAAVPRAVREGSLALGASKWETTWRVVLPAASPGILTGVILAVSRAAGEVAPLMLTGAVKTANLLPLDSTAPFLHVERKFMHLGFHVYDLGFQSPNVEAAKPMVFMTTLFLVAIVVILNVLAMWIRNRLWSRYRSASF
jgi:phosphate transport system permease protein